MQETSTTTPWTRDRSNAAIVGFADAAEWLAQVDAGVNRSVKRLALGGRHDLAAEMLAAHIVKTEVTRTKVHGPAASYFEAARRFNAAAAECAIRLLGGAA